MTSWFK